MGPCEAASLVSAMPIGAVGGPVPTEARQGRQLQRYAETGERLVAGCLPVRYTSKEAGLSGVRVLLVSSRGGKAWSFPKGGWETDETVEAAARRETVEESGVRGVLELPMIGEFPFVSGKALRGVKQTAYDGRCVAYVFCLYVEEELSKWPEYGQRQRAWFTIPEAMALLKSDWMRDAVVAWVRRQGWDARPLVELAFGHSNSNGTSSTAAAAQRAAPAPSAAAVANGNAAAALIAHGWCGDENSTSAKGTTGQ